MDQELTTIEKILIDTRNRNVSIRQAYLSNIKIINIISLRHLYYLIQSNKFSISFDDLVQSYKRKLKLHKNTYLQSKKPPEVMYNRTFINFIEYLSENNDFDIFELDSVIGKISDKKAILTVYSRETSLQFGFIINKGNSVSVNAVLIDMFERYGMENSKKIFKVFLADNVYEF